MTIPTYKAENKFPFPSNAQQYHTSWLPFRIFLELAFNLLLSLGILLLPAAFYIWAVAASKQPVIFSSRLGLFKLTCSNILAHTNIPSCTFVKICFIYLLPWKALQLKFHALFQFMRRAINGVLYLCTWLKEALYSKAWMLFMFWVQSGGRWKGAVFQPVLALDHSSLNSCPNVAANLSVLLFGCKPALR